MTGAFICVALCFEAGLWCRASWELQRGTFASLLEAEVILHGRIVRALLVMLGWAAAWASRPAVQLYVRTDPLTRLVAFVALVTPLYICVHGCLERRLAELTAMGADVITPRHSSLSEVGIAPQARARLALRSGMTGRGGAALPGDCNIRIETARSAAMRERRWHGLVVNIFLGAGAAGLVFATVWLTGLYRIAGGAGGVIAGGGVRLVGGAAIVGAVIAGVLVHGDPLGSHGDGFARSADVRRFVSARAARQTARVTRPGIGRSGRPAVTQVGTLLGRVGARKAWASLKDVILVVAPPQTGKTAYLGGRIIEAPGSVVVTSTKADIHVHTAALRSERGPVSVFNPEGLGGIPSTFRWSPVAGCTDPEVASERAGYLLSGAEKDGGENAVFWREMNCKLLRCLLLAAALTDRSMREVWGWINDSVDPTPLRILESEIEVPPEWVGEMRQLLHGTPERTRQSVYLTLAQTMQFMTSPAIAEAICPTAGEVTFSIEGFLAEGATLYLLGSDRPYASLVPLFTAITGYVFEGAKRAAGRAFNGRLDPPLTLALDEAALICPVPLPSMTADSGGRGVQLLIAVQSPSQLYERWGQRGGETIWNNANAKLVLGGLSHAADLDDLSKVCGHKDEPVRTLSAGHDGQRSTATSIRTVPVLAPHEIRQIADGKALLLYRNMAPVLVRIERVWDRRDVKAAATAARKADQRGAAPAAQTRPAGEVTAKPSPAPGLPELVALPTAAAPEPAAASNVVALHPVGDEEGGELVAGDEE